MKQIEVTKEDIENGARKTSMRCPIALALTRTLGADCSVGLNDIYIQGVRRCVELPWPARAFIMRYDEGEAVVPFCFEIPD
jgi:hypothetical protein